LVWRLEQVNAAIAYSLQKEPLAPPTSSAVVTRVPTEYARRMGGVRRTQHLILLAFAKPLDVLMKRRLLSLIQGQMELEAMETVIQRGARPTVMVISIMPRANA